MRSSLANKRVIKSSQWFRGGLSRTKSIKDDNNDDNDDDRAASAIRRRARVFACVRDGATLPRPCINKMAHKTSRR